MRSMEKNLKNHAVVGICAIGLIGLNSCLRVDDTYDLEKDIDITITVGGDLSIPGSNTEEIKLADLLDLEEDGVIQADANGDYHLLQNGDRAETDVMVKKVFFDLRDESSFSKADQTVNIPANTTGSEHDVVFNKNISINVNKGDVTSDIKSIRKAVTSCYETYMVFSMNSNIADAKIDDGYRIEFPDYITVVSMNPDWKVSEDGHALVLDNEAGMEFTDNTKVQFQIVGISFEYPEATFTYNANLEDQNSISLGGSIKLNGKITATANSNSGGDVTFTANVESESMYLETVTAVVDPKVKIEVESITLNDLPEFLTDNNVVIDLTDPKIYITLTNPSPVAVTVVRADLFSYKEGKADQHVEIPEFTVPAKKTEGYTICINQIEGAQEEGVDEFVTVTDLSDIIKYIPERIEITNINTKVEEEEVEINVGENYIFTTDYKVDTPLKFGNETEIIYNEVMDGWDADLEDVEFKSVAASMEVVNAIPLGVELTAKAIDKYGEVMENVTVDLDVNLAAGSIKNPTRQNVEFSMTTKDGSIKGLDGISISVKANSSQNTEDVSLKKDQFMQFNNVKLSLKGGITMDLN